VSTEKPLDEVAGGLDGVAVLHMRLLGKQADKLLDDPGGGHADERETSVMLALDPRSVRMDRLAVEGDFTTTGATGDPSRATAFKGERILAARIDDLVARLVAMWPELRSES
jgi:creatinine amidohydrolase